MEKKVYEYLRDVLCPNGGRGNVRYYDVCVAFRGDITQIGVMNTLKLLNDEGKIMADCSTYAAYVVLK